MTISSTNNKNVYVGDTSTLVFAYTFRIFEDSDLNVTIQDTSVTPQTEITLVLGVDYSVSGAGSPTGGDVTLILGSQLSVAPIATDNITIQRVIPLTQEIDYVENDEFPADSHEEGLDRGTMIDQQLQEEVDRCLQIPANLSGIDTTLPPPEAGAPIGWNDTADGLTNNPDNLHTVKVDTDANPDFLGNTGGDGALRVSGLLTYTDGGDFVTIGLTNGAIDHDQLANFTATEHFTMLDEDDMLSNSDTQAATQQSIVAYVASQVATANEFVEMTDTPANYTSASLDFVRVNAGETGLEFVTPDYSLISAGDAATDVTAAELETLTDGSTTALHAHTYATISGADAGTDITAVELETLTDGSNADALHTHASITNDQVKVDAAATADYIGELATNGVIRTTTPFSYTDGGDFVTITLDTTANFTSTGTWQFGRVEIEGTGTYIDVDGGGNMTFTDAVTGTETLANLVGGGGGGASLTRAVGQAGHGFVVGDWVRLSGSETYVKALADTVANAESVGVVSAVADPNNFTVQFGGRVTGLSGLTVAAAHFLSDTTAGTITDTATTTEGSVVKPVLIADTTTTGYLFNMRGNVLVSGGTSFYFSFVDGDLTAGVLSLNHNLGHKFAIVQVYDENDDLVYLDNVNLVDDDNLDIDLSSFTVHASSPWRAVILDQGNVAATTSNILSFTSASPEYSAGTVTHTHNLDQQYAQVWIYDNTDKRVQPGDVTATSSTVSTIDLTAFHPITGTWRSVARR